MTLQQFIELSKDEQGRQVKEHGVKLGERLQPDFKYEIYQVGDFYVECKFGQIENEDLVGLQTFGTIEELEPYLQVIDLKTDGSDKS